MATFPAIGAYIDWADLCNAPGYSEYASCLRNPLGTSSSSAWYNYVCLDEPYGASVVDDMAGAASLTPVGVTLGRPGGLGRSAATCGWFGGAGYIPIPSGGSFSSSVGATVAAMVRPSAFTGGYIISSGTGGIGLYVDASGYVVLTVPGTGDLCTSTVTLAIDRWSHVAATYDGTTARIYVDGADVSGATTVRTYGSGVRPVIGATSTAGPTYSSFFVGHLAEVAAGAGVMTGRTVAYIASLARSPWAETNADMTGLISEPLTVKRGRSSDYGSDAAGSCSFRLNNADRRYDPMRNWCDNGSMETDLSNWTGDAGPYCAGGIIRRVRDTAGYGGSYAGEVDSAATVYGGVAYDIAYPVLPGVTYSVFVALKSISGQTAWDLLVGSETDAADYALTAVTITGAWAGYTLTWTPRAASSEVRVVVRTATATAGTFRIDALAFSAGSTTTFIEAPTRGQLVPGRSVLLTASYDTTSEPLFFGGISSYSPDAASLSVDVSASDAFAQLDRAILTYAGYTGTHLGYRAEILRRALAGWKNEDRGSWSAIAGSGTTQTRTRTRPLLDLPANEAVRFRGRMRIGSGPGVAAGVVSLRISAYVTGATPVYLDVPQGAIGGEWVDFDLSYKVQGSVNLVEYGFVKTASAGSLELADISLTTGPAARPYVPFGDSHLRSFRHNAAYRNPAAEAHQGYWDAVPVNRIANPTFATNTTGWGITALGVIGASTSITRTAGGYDDGWCGRVVTSGVGQGAWVAAPGTFAAGQTYGVLFHAKGVSSSMDIVAGIFSASYGPGAAWSAVTTVPTGAWTRFIVWFTAPTTLTDMYVGFYKSAGAATTVDVDMAAAYSAPAPDQFELSGAVPLGIDASATESTFTRITGDGHAGDACLKIVTGNAIAFPLQKPGTWPGTTPGAYEAFDGDVTPGQNYYTANLWVKTPSAGTTVYLSMGRQSDPGKAATTTYTTATNTWERVVVRWNATTGNGLLTDVWVVLRGVVNTKVTDLVVSEGRRAWPLRTFADGLDPAEEDWLVPAATPSGSALSALTALNAANMTRHWVDPLSRAPFWVYRTRAASTLPAKTVAETYEDDIAGITGADTSYDTVSNVVHVTPSTRYIIPDSPTGGYVGTASGYSGDAYASNADSVGHFGRSDGGSIEGDFWENIPGDLTLQKTIGELAVARYAAPRPRPSIVVENRWPSQLVRGPDDLIALNFPRLGLSYAPYLITSIQHDIGLTGRYWKTTYQLEEFGYAPTDYSLAGGLPEYAGVDYSLPAGMPM